MKKIMFSMMVAIMFLFSGASAAKDGAIIMLDACPGDEITDADEKELSAIALALLTPLLTGVFNKAIGKSSEYLKEKASEKKVDSLHYGDYFYRLKSAGAGSEDLTIAYKSKCMIVASRSSMSTTKTSNSDLLKDYRGYVTSIVNSKKKRSIQTDKTKINEAIKVITDSLEEFGFNGNVTPGMLALLELDYSEQNTEFRVLPRYFVLSHSIRERKVDNKKRDFALETKFTIPGQKESVAEFILKFESIVAKNAKNFDLTKPAIVNQVASSWMPIPELNASVASVLKTYKDKKNTYYSLLESAKLAGQKAFALKANDWVDSSGNKWEPIEPDYSCPSDNDAISSDINTAAVQLEIEETQDKPAVDELKKWSNVITYFKSCRSSNIASKANSKVLEAVTKSEGVRAFDLAIQISEFRERPILEFLGDVLGDTTVASGITSALVGSLDTSSEKTLEKTNNEAFETALLAAEKSVLTFNNADDKDKASSFLQMEFDKRKANRAALEVGTELPYPAAGIWGR